MSPHKIIRAMVSNVSFELGTEIARAFASLSLKPIIGRARYPRIRVTSQLLMDGNLGQVLELFGKIDQLGGVDVVVNLTLPNGRVHLSSNPIESGLIIPLSITQMALSRQLRRSTGAGGSRVGPATVDRSKLHDLSFGIVINVVGYSALESPSTRFWDPYSSLLAGQVALLHTTRTVPFLPPLANSSLLVTTPHAIKTGYSSSSTTPSPQSSVPRMVTIVAPPVLSHSRRAGAPESWLKSQRDDSVGIARVVDCILWSLDNANSGEVVVVTKTEVPKVIPPQESLMLNNAANTALPSRIAKEGPSKLRKLKL
ncbi:hypothetical protein M427DRAFT_154162 [Gonapodya prolifera JEL478]|uniref:Uncharacterized protein n=1 Tax=Gonapodya prolifera (strain JEL478) TaxID=1344416 RepID=A0A139AKN5_GONPJ|nr:hypothetical protein M427DRAFT_154162 [Gonapodya prolifera JEL478]|eukprot:KXS17063.1 hypothetical protein M427DRAFT_154162 [Gonapodya prolifera JEL478]